jgi:hypothetical protein
MPRPVPARRSHLRRTTAFLLLAVFLSAGTSLPGLDAMVYHGAAEVERSQSHIEPAGGCLDHSQHCALGRTASGSGAAAVAAGEIHADQGQRSVLPRPLAQLLFAIDRTGISQSRAPPADLA